MNRDGFMRIVYDEFASNPDNCRANRIIDAADEYAESAQLGTNLAEVGTDTISRQQAIDALGEQPLAWEQGEYEEGMIAQWESDVEAIKALPPVTPEQRTGKWIKPTFIQNRAFDIVHCSECGGVPCGVDENTHYCPNCGAKMEGDAE